MPEQELSDEGRRLIQAAFDVARGSGQENWRLMTVAVLKNRILDLTNREFDETRWGAHSFREFVELFGDTVELDVSTRPPTVELRVGPPPASSTTRRDQGAPSTAAGPRVTGPDRRIRPDLWRAVLDYSSGAVYVWDQGRAIGVVPSELREGDLRPRLPTIGESELGKWRRSFAAGSSSDEPERMRESVARWAEERLPDASLPRNLRRRWNGELKQRVLTRLEEWSVTEGIPLPTDVVQAAEAPFRDEPATEQLRDLVIRAVHGMSREELEQLRLPPAALLRSRP